MQFPAISQQDHLGIDKIILKFIWKRKRTVIVKIISSKVKGVTLSDLRTYIAKVIKTV